MKDMTTCNTALQHCISWHQENYSVQKYPEATSTEISVEFPINYLDPTYATVMYSPTKYDEENDCYTDYDWFDVELTYGEIAALIELAEKNERI